MKQFFSTMIAGFMLLSANGQKSAEDNSLVFVTKKDDGNSKFIKYTALNFGYTSGDYLINDQKMYQLKSKAYHFGLEFYNTFSKKVAGTENFNFGGFDKNFYVGIDYGLYFLLVKGLYIKPRIGYVSVYDNITNLNPYLLTYGGDIGYLFRISKPDARKPTLLSLFAGYSAMTGNDSGYDYNYDYNYYTYKMSGYNVGLKIMFGPKATSAPVQSERVDDFK